MRRRITSAVLRERFAKAWAILPASEQQRLRSFIRYVDEVTVLEGTFVYGRTKPGKGIDPIMGPIDGGTGFTALFTLDSGDAVDIILPTDPLVSCDEGMALAIILHELAHAYDYLIDPDQAINLIHYYSERYAWTQAMAWSCRSSLPERLKANVDLYSQLAIRADIEAEAERRQRQ